MQKELSYLYKDKNFELEKLPKDKRALKNKWVLIGQNLQVHKCRL